MPGRPFWKLSEQRGNAQGYGRRVQGDSGMRAKLHVVTVTGHNLGGGVATTVLLSTRRLKTVAGRTPAEPQPDNFPRAQKVLGRSYLRP